MNKLEKKLYFNNIKRMTKRKLTVSEMPGESADIVIRCSIPRSSPVISVPGLLFSLAFRRWWWGSLPILPVERIFYGRRGSGWWTWICLNLCRWWVHTLKPILIYGTRISGHYDTHSILHVFCLCEPGICSAFCPLPFALCWWLPETPLIKTGCLIPIPGISDSYFWGYLIVIFGDIW